MIRRPPRSTLFPTRRSSDLVLDGCGGTAELPGSEHPAVANRYAPEAVGRRDGHEGGDRKSTRLNSSHANISYAVFCLKKKHAVIQAYKLIKYIHSINHHRDP